MNSSLISHITLWGCIDGKQKSPKRWHDWDVGKFSWEQGSHWFIEIKLLGVGRCVCMGEFKWRVKCRVLAASPCRGDLVTERDVTVEGNDTLLSPSRKNSWCVLPIWPQKNSLKIPPGWARERGAKYVIISRHLLSPPLEKTSSFYTAQPPNSNNWYSWETGECSPVTKALTLAWSPHWIHRFWAIFALLSRASGADGKRGNGQAPCERWSLKQHCIEDIAQRRHVPATFCQFSASTLALKALGCGNHLLFHTCRRVNRPAQNHGNWQECEKEKSQSPGCWASLLRLKQGWCPGWGKRGWESGGSSNP